VFQDAAALTFGLLAWCDYQDLVGVDVDLLTPVRDVHNLVRGMHFTQSKNALVDPATRIGDLMRLGVARFQGIPWIGSILAGHPLVVTVVQHQQLHIVRQTVGPTRMRSKGSLLLWHIDGGQKIILVKTSGHISGQSVLVGAALHRSLRRQVGVRKAVPVEIHGHPFDGHFGRLLIIVLRGFGEVQIQPVDAIPVAGAPALRAGSGRVQPAGEAFLVENMTAACGREDYVVCPEKLVTNCTQNVQRRR